MGPLLQRLLCRMVQTVDKMVVHEQEETVERCVCVVGRQKKTVSAVGSSRKLPPHY